MKQQILALTAIAAIATSAFATPRLRLTDGANTITVVDGDVNDQGTDPGVVFYNGPVGPNWTVNITIGTSKPAIGSPSEPYLDLDTTSVSTHAGDLTVEYTDTDFTPSSGTWDAEVGGTSAGSIEFTYFLDASNVPFGTNTPLADFPNQADFYAASSNGTFNINAPFSMTVRAQIHHPGRGTTGFDQSLQLTPPQQQPPSIQCAGDRDLGCNPAAVPDCDTNSLTINASCGVSNITCSAAGPDIVTGCVHERDLVYTVTDNCGQSTSCTQHIYWTVDHNAPQFTTCPGDIDLGCNPQTLPDCDLSKVSASDDCGRAVITCASSDSANGCAHTRTITYTATDSCGNRATCVQHVTWVVDTTAPSFTTCAPDQNLGCNPQTIPDCDLSKVAATDDCGTPTITCSKSDNADGCAHTRVITYVATDACGNSSSCVQHITWTADTTAPTFTKCASDMSLGCNPQTVPDCDNSTVAATDDCGTPRISCSKSDSADGCAHTRVITYVATDACGNSSSCVQHITWTADTTAPTFTRCAADRNLGCNPTTIPGCDTSTVSATDNCGTPTVTCSSSDSTTGCSHTRTITYVAADACGNSSSCVQHITWTADTTAPSFTRCAADQTLGCNPTTVPTGDVTAVAATDTCSTPVISSSYSDSSSNCGRTRTITYVATDACGNSASCVQHITWTVDTTAPVFTKKPADINYTCRPATIPGADLSTVAASDTCSTPVITPSVSDATNGCTATRTITYTATDACGNSSSYAQHITWPTCLGAIGDFVWNDKNHNGIQDAGEPGIIGVVVNLHDCSTSNIIQTTTTDVNGYYLFTNLSACSSYYVEFQIPPATSFVFTTPHASGSTTSNDSNANETGNHGPGTTACYNVTPGQTNSTIDAGMYLPTPPTTTLGHGDTATIGFWHNKNGQALILAMPSPGLGNWLATNYPCMFGNLKNQPNTVVAAQFQIYFNVTGQKTYAQVMAGALADFVTSTTLSGGTKAAPYGFNTSPGGTGAKSFNVGSNGTALGLVNNTSYTVTQLLQAAQAKCPWSLDAFNALNNIFDGINQGGDIN
jgi:hypothetical protein